MNDNAVTNNAVRLGVQYTARNEMKFILFAVHDYRVSRIASAPDASADIILSRQNVNQLSFPFVAPLGSYNDVDLADLGLFGR